MGRGRKTGAVGRGGKALHKRMSEAVSAQASGDMGTAMAMLSGILETHPRHAPAWTNLGAVFRARGDLLRAVQAQRRAHALAPEDPAIRNNLANVLDDTGDHARAAQLRLGLVRQFPDNADHAAQLVRSVRVGGNPEAALQTAKGAATRFPESAEVAMQVAETQLLAGEYAAGFAAYGARWHLGKAQLPRMPIPRWEGDAIEGKRLLVMNEQGFGDTLCAARFLPMLRRTGARVTLLSKAPTARLFQGLDGVVKVLTGEVDPGRFDLWVPIWDLARFHFREGLELPPPAPLSVPDDARLRARARLKPYGDALKVGVVWTGSVTNEINDMRSFDHGRLVPLAGVPGVQLVSLYKGPQLEAFRADGTAAFIPDLCGDDRDLADCAALIRELDLVITADTVTGHIAGALGVPVWVLLHWEAFWLWGTDPERTPWYPSMRFFRQVRPGDWGDVFDRVAGALHDRVAGPSDQLSERL